MQVFFSIFWWIYFYIFFTSYPLAYLLFHLAGRNKNFNQLLAEKVYPLLPLSYATVASCFWILTLFSGRINFVFEKITPVVSSALIIVYSLSGLLFWLPVVRKKNILSLIHSLLLFLLPPLNMLSDKFKHRVVPHDYIITLLRIYTAGLLIYLIIIGFLLLIKWIIAHKFTLHHHKV